MLEEIGLTVCLKDGRPEQTGKRTMLYTTGAARGIAISESYDRRQGSAAADCGALASHAVQAEESGSRHTLGSGSNSKGQPNRRIERIHEIGRRAASASCLGPVRKFVLVVLVPVAKERRSGTAL